MKTIAEHVESEQILNQVDEIGIDYCQGYFVDAEVSRTFAKEYIR
jgi:EAL domain-containing protein (putative c-di-GMP-specific phosphodiesterase class I)